MNGVRQHGEPGAGHRHPPVGLAHERSLVDQAPDELLEEEGIALGPPQDLSAQPGRQLRPREQPGDELPALRLRQRIEPDRHRARNPIGKRGDSRPVRPRRRDEQHRAVRADRQRVQHLHEPVVRPVEVLEHEHQRTARRERGDKPRPGPGDVLAHLLRFHPFERALRERETGRCGKGVRHQPHLVIRRADVRQRFAHPVAQLVACRLRGIVEGHAERRSQDLAERPVGDPPARREAAPAVDGRAGLETAGAVDELLHQPALPDAGGAAHEDRPHLSRRRRLTEARHQDRRSPAPGRPSPS